MPERNAGRTPQTVYASGHPFATARYDSARGPSRYAVKCRQAAPRQRIPFLYARIHQETA